MNIYNNNNNKMCNNKMSNNNIKVNSKINNYFFNNVDLCKSIDDIIGEYFGNDNNRNYGCFSNVDLVNCELCNVLDLDNEDNFKVICCGCDMKICFDCFNNNNKEDLEEIICNREEDIRDWLCYDCGACCEVCEHDAFKEKITGLKDRNGDFKYVCHNCINDNELDFYYDGESYDKEGCRVNDDESIIAIKEEVECFECNGEYDEDIEHFFINDKDIVCWGCVEMGVCY